MLKQYKLRFYNFRLIIFSAGDQPDRSYTGRHSSIGPAIKAVCRSNTWTYCHADPFFAGLLMDHELSVDHVWI